MRSQSAAGQYYLGLVLAKDQAEPPFEALELWKSVVKLDAKDAGPCLELARAAAAKEQIPEASNWLQLALERDPKLASAHYKLSMLYARTGDTEKAAVHLRQFRELKPR
jgi:Flp pilus assembly protein TadD